MACERLGIDEADPSARQTISGPEVPPTATWIRRPWHLLTRDEARWTMTTQGARTIAAPVQGLIYHFQGRMVVVQFRGHGHRTQRMIRSEDLDTDDTTRSSPPTSAATKRTSSAAGQPEGPPPTTWPLVTVAMAVAPRRGCHGRTMPRSRRPTGRALDTADRVATGLSTVEQVRRGATVLCFFTFNTLLVGRFCLIDSCCRSLRSYWCPVLGFKWHLRSFEFAIATGTLLHQGIFCVGVTTAHLVIGA